METSRFRLVSCLEVQSCLISAISFTSQPINLKRNGKVPILKLTEKDKG
jgi:hypothetical protein